MEKINKILPAIIILLAVCLVNPPSAVPARDAEIVFNEWKEAYDADDFAKSVSLIKELLEADPAYREKAQGYLDTKKKDMAYQRVETDPLLRRRIEQEQHLKRAKAVKDAFDIGISESFVYDTNPFRKERNVKYDYIIETAPFIGLNLSDPESGMDALVLNYTLYYYTYLRHKEQNRFDHRVNFDFKAPRLLSMFGRKISLNVRDYFHPGTYYSTSESSKYLYQVYNELETEVALTMTEKTSLSMTYEHNIQWYIRDDFENFNYQKNMISPSFYYHITPKTSIFGGYAFSVFDYYEGGLYESHSNIIRGGMVGELTPKSSIRLSTGYEFRDYHSAPHDEDVDKYVLEFAYTNRLSQKTTMVAHAERSIKESTYRPNPYFLTTMGGLRMNQMITPKLSFTLDGTVINNEYPKKIVVDTPTNKLKRRRDWIYNLSGGLAYNMTSWLSAGFDYRLTQRISNVNEQSYIDHVFTTNIKARY